MTPLDKILRRSLTINGVDYVVTISPQALKLTRKGRRLGLELKWADLTSGESALAVALQASVGQFEPGQKNAPQTRRATQVTPKKRSQRSRVKQQRRRRD